MTQTLIEKAAKLMGLKYHRVLEEGLETEYSYEDYVGDNSSRREWFGLFNPYTNKADLVDVECATIKYGMLRVMHFSACVVVQFEEYADTSKPYSPEVFENRQFYLHHDTYFTARAHAVMAVVEQIYDRREG